MKSKFFHFIIILFVFNAGFVYAASDDQVLRVQVDGYDVGIQMAREGWVVVKGNSSNEESVDRILMLALSLLNTQTITGYFDAGENGLEDWSTYSNVRVITVLEIKNRG